MIRTFSKRLNEAINVTSPKYIISITGINIATDATVKDSAYRRIFALTGNEVEVKSEIDSDTEVEDIKANTITKVFTLFCRESRSQNVIFGILYHKKYIKNGAHAGTYFYGFPVESYSKCHDVNEFVIKTIKSAYNKGKVLSDLVANVAIFISQMKQH